MFRFGQGKWIGESVYYAKKVQVVLCSTPLVTEIIQFVDMSNSKTTSKNSKKVVGILVQLNVLQEDDGITQNFKKGKANWHKNCTLELSALK